MQLVYCGGPLRPLVALREPYAGLSSLAPVRLSVDFGQDALRFNRNSSLLIRNELPHAPPD